jgi:hypothetical protein
LFPQAAVENELLKDIHTSVETGFVENKPPHHHPSARDPNFNPENPPESCIFVVEYADFIEMTDRQLQSIFHRRHILVLNAPLRDEGFSLQTLSKYANIKRTMSIVGESLKRSCKSFRSKLSQTFHCRRRMKTGTAAALSPIFTERP